MFRWTVPWICTTLFHNASHSHHTSFVCQYSFSQEVNREGALVVVLVVERLPWEPVFSTETDRFTNTDRVRSAALTQCACAQTRERCVEWQVERAQICLRSSFSTSLPVRNNVNFFLPISLTTTRSRLASQRHARTECLLGCVSIVVLSRKLNFVTFLVLFVFVMLPPISLTNTCVSVGVEHASGDARLHLP